MDKFNDIWKNRFNEGDLPVGDWNTPDDLVWDNILPHVPAKKDNRRKWWLISLLILIGSILAYFSLVKASAKDISVSEKEEIAVKPSNILANFQEELLTTSKAVKEDETILDKIPNAKGRINKKVKSPSKDKSIVVETIAYNNSIRIKTPKPTSKDADKTIVALKNTLVTSLSNKSVSKEKAKETLGDLSMLPLRNIMFEYEPEAYSLPSEVKINIEEIRKPKLNLRASTGAILWQHKISDQYTSDLAPFEFNYSNDIGWAVNLEVQLPVNKYLDIFGGVQYEQIETSSGHNSALTYKLNIEQGERTNDYQLDLATPYGLSQASFRFDRIENVSGGSVNLLVDFHSRHTIKNLSIPVGIKVFPLGKQKRFVPSANIGLGTNYLMNISNGIQGIDTHHSSIQYTKQGVSTFASPELNKWHFDMRLGLGLDYNITNDIQLNLNMDWSRGLNPIFKQENYNTKINRYRLSLGLTKVFSK